MEKSEYRADFVWASTENAGVSDYLKTRFPNWKNPPKFAPQTMMPELNKFWGKWLGINTY